jgi:hypothetical protein
MNTISSTGLITYSTRGTPRPWRHSSNADGTSSAAMPTAVKIRFMSCIDA